MDLCLQASRLHALGVRHGFSLRPGGVSAPPFSGLNLGWDVGDAEGAVTENHRRLASELGYRPLDLCEARQVHGSAVHVVDAAPDAPALARTLRADALVSGAPGHPIAVRTADCLPMILVAPRSKAVAVVHAGWRGLVAGVLPAAVDSLCALAGEQPSTLQAAMFPHIGRCCFEIGEEVAQHFCEISESAVSRPAGAVRPFGSLVEIVRHQWVSAGASDQALQRVPGCTACDASRFFSFRRDGSASGRHLTVVVPG